MPVVTGAVFFPVILVAVWMLSQLPPPTPEDEALRVKREPMNARARRGFVFSFFPGLFALTFLYMFLTAYRDFRDNFSFELWSELGYGKAPEIMTTAELPVAFGVMVVLGLLMLVRNNRAALIFVHGVMLAGAVLIGLSIAAWQLGVLSNVAWMVLVGLGLYCAYVPYGCMLFDRMIATLGVIGTAGFMIYATDAFGYLGTVGLLIYKNFGNPDLSWLDFFARISYATSVLCTVCFALSGLYFAWKSRQMPDQTATARAPCALVRGRD